MGKKKTTKPPNEWTVMVYMAGDNTLAGESVWALTEMNQVAFSPGVETIALFDSGPPEVKTRRFVFNHNSGAATRLEELGEVFQLRIPGKKKAKPEIVESASDYRLLRHFLETTLKAHPAKKNILVLSGHGSGAVGDFLTSDNPRGDLSIPDLQKVLTAIRKKTLRRKLDILGMDSCLMSMVEVGYELRDAVSLLVGAEGFEPSTGWPYRQVLTALNRQPTMDAPQFAKAVVEEHVSYYQDYVMAGLSTDQSVCDLARLDELAEALRALATAMTAPLTVPAVRDAIVLAHWRAQSYKSEQYVDLWDFCDLLRRGCAVKEIAEACQYVQAKVEQAVPCADYYGTAFQHSHGLSIYFPWQASGSLDQYCQGLSFAKATKWGNFLQSYVKQTARPMRGDTRTKPGEPLAKALEEVKISAAISPLVIPLAADFPGDNRHPPGSDRHPPGSDRHPPGSDRSLSGQGTMKNAPRYFLRRKKDKKAAH